MPDADGSFKGIEEGRVPIAQSDPTIPQRLQLVEEPERSENQSKNHPRVERIRHPEALSRAETS